MNWTEERLAKLRLARTTGIGPLTFQKRLEKHSTAIEALAKLPERAKQAGRRSLAIPDRSRIEREVRETETFGAQIVFPGDDHYPTLLAELSPPPPVLTLLGRPELAARPCVAMVGARNASAAGMKIAREMAAELGEKGWVVVSGLARGVDTAAHNGALQTGTISVIAGGIDNIYPPQNESLYRSVSEQGLLVCENPVGFSPRAKDFPRRNRLITGLSLGVVVVEAALKSGSLISARTALEQGREVMAVPGSPLDPRSRGSNGLIRSGASLVETSSDVLDILSPMQVQEQRQMDFLFSDSHEDEFVSEDALPEPEALLGYLSAVPVSITDLSRASDIPDRHCASLLVELELSGKVRSLPGGLVQKAL